MGSVREEEELKTTVCSKKSSSFGRQRSVSFLLESLTVDLIQTWLLWNGGRRVFVERAPVAGEVQLFIYIHVLISKDLRRPSCSGGARSTAPGDYSHTTPRSATSSDLDKDRVSGRSRNFGATHNSSFCASDSWRRSTPCSSVPRAGVRVMTLDAVDSRFFFSRSAPTPLSTTSTSLSGSQEMSGKVG